MISPSNEIPNEDTYALLEFQGIVADVPTYDSESGKLEFVARALNRPTLKFFAQGETALAFKNLLHKGAWVQLTATPFPKMETLGVTRVRVIEWEAKRMEVLGVRKTNLGKFSDVRILDGLMPGDEVRDVGFIDPDEAAEKAKQDERGQKLLAERKDLEKEGEYDD
jgi:hypothetical protein